MRGLILPMILLCNDGRPSTACGTGDGTTCPCSTAAVPASGLAHTEAKDKVWSVLKATSGTNMGSSQDLIVGNWLITKHICENHTTHVRSLGTAADLAAQLEHAAHAIVHAMKPSGITAGYNQQKMCLGQVVSSKACDGDTSSSAYACACFDKAAAANRGQGIKFHQSPARRGERTPKPAETARRRETPQRRTRKAQDKREREQK
ncbi:hypothetical protein ERJ75_000646000 [Trypanosoma vivax]|nr:hypothetical protein ERJ75_000646000 [Trypanosoma vivax]